MQQHEVLFASLKRTNYSLQFISMLYAFSVIIKYEVNLSIFSVVTETSVI